MKARLVGWWPGGWEGYEVWGGASFGVWGGRGCCAVRGLEWNVTWSTSRKIQCSFHRYDVRWSAETTPELRSTRWCYQLLARRVALPCSVSLQPLATCHATKFGRIVRNVLGPLRNPWFTLPQQGHGPGGVMARHKYHQWLSGSSPK